MMKHYNVPISENVPLMIDLLPYNLKKLLHRVVCFYYFLILRLITFHLQNELTDLLLKLQPKYYSILMNDIKDFENDLDKIVKKYDQNGPMEHGITIEETTRRVSIFTVNVNEN
jgi:hypothetical protein